MAFAIIDVIKTNDAANLDTHPGPKNLLTISDTSFTPTCFVSDDSENSPLSDDAAVFLLDDRLDGVADLRVEAADFGLGVVERLDRLGEADFFADLAFGVVDFLETFFFGVELDA